MLFKSCYECAHRTSTSGADPTAVVVSDDGSDDGSDEAGSVEVGAGGAGSDPKRSETSKRVMAELWLMCVTVQ